MNHITKSLLALDDFIKNVPVTEKERIWYEVKKLNIQGPTVREYFINLFYHSNIRFTFDERIELSSYFKPPDTEFKLIIETPKEFLESFF